MDTNVRDTTAVVLLDLNQATYEELVALPYIGEVLAQRILEYRESRGGFSRVEELQDVPGIHQAAYDRLRDLLTVSQPQEMPENDSLAEVAYDLPSEEADDSSAEGADGSSPEAAESTPELFEEPEAVSQTTPQEASPVRSAHNWSWLWGALLGGFLGMIFSLLVLAGINGSLDVADSYGMRSMTQQVEEVSTELPALQTQVDTMQQQLDALQDVMGRVERLETSSAALEQEVSIVRDKVATMDSDLSDLSDDVGSLEKQLAQVQGQVQQTVDFFTQLRVLLDRVFDAPQPQASPMALPLLNSEGHNE